MGGGVVGLACAWELARRDVAVAVVDAGRLGGGASHANAGWVCPTLVTPLAAPGMVREGVRQLVRREGAFVLRPSLRLLPWLALFARNCTARRYEANRRALLDLERGTLALYDAYSDAGVEFEEHRQGLVIAALTEDVLDHYRGLGAHDVDPAIEPALDRDAVAGAVLGETDRHVRPESLIAGLAQSLRGMGAELHEGRAVAAVDRRGAEWVVRTADGELAARSVVVAAGLGSARLLRPHGVQLRLAGARGYSVDVAGEGEPPRHALYLAEAKLAVSPFASSVRIAGVLELGGRHRPPDLAAAARPYLRGWQPVHAGEIWSGLRPATPDGVPRVGPVADGLYVATGHAMLGVTLAPATARRLASWIA